MKELPKNLKDPQRTDTQNAALLCLLFTAFFAIGQLFASMNTMFCFILIESGIFRTQTELVLLLSPWVINVLVLLPGAYWIIRVYKEG